MLGVRLRDRGQLERGQERRRGMVKSLGSLANKSYRTERGCLDKEEMSGGGHADSFQISEKLLQGKE